MMGGRIKSLGLWLVVGVALGSTVVVGCGNQAPEVREAPIERDAKGKPILPGATTAPTQ